MRKAILLAVIAAATLTSCASNQKKAEALVSKYLNTVLNDFKSYEPVSTIVDTLYDLPTWDKDVQAKAKKVLYYRKSAAKFKEEADAAQQDMYIWLPNFTQYGKMKYDEAYTKFYTSSIMSFKQKIDEFKNERDIVEMAARFNPENQIGWMVEHKFRSNNAAGAAVLDDCLFLVDEGFKNVNAMYSSNNQEAADTMTEIMNILQSKNDLAFYDKMISDYEGLVTTYEESLKKAH